MSFNPNIPQSTDDLSDSQGDLLQNNLALDASFGRDHLPFSNLTGDNGKHKFVEIVNSAAIPAPVPGLSAGSGTIYTKKVGGPLESQIFYTPDASGAEFQLTRVKAADVSQFGVMNPYGTPPAGTTQIGGWTFLPGALFFQYGKFVVASFPITAQGAKTIQFPVPFAVGCFVVNFSFIINALPSANSMMGVRSTSLTDFTVQYDLDNSSEIVGIYWTAIGA